MKCLICNSGLTKKIGLNDGYSGFHCPECDLVSTETRPGDTFNTVNSANYSNGFQRILEYGVRRKEFIYRYDVLYKKFGLSEYRSILEIGSNIGFFSKFLIANGHQVVSVEVNEDLCRLQEALFKIVPEKSLGLVQNESVDLVVSMDVIEHIPDLRCVLVELKKKMKIGAYFYVQLPNKNSLIAKIAGARWGWWSAPDHLYHFSERSLTRLLRESGFEVVCSKAFSPILDDLSHVSFVKYFVKPFWFINRLFPLNRLVFFSKGSLLGVVAKNCG